MPPYPSAFSHGMPPPTQEQIDRSARFERLGWLEWDDDDLFPETDSQFASRMMEKEQEEESMLIKEEGIDDHFEDFP